MAANQSTHKCNARFVKTVIHDFYNQYDPARYVMKVKDTHSGIQYVIPTEAYNIYTLEDDIDVLKHLNCNDDVLFLISERNVAVTLDSKAVSNILKSKYFMCDKYELVSWTRWAEEQLVKYYGRSQTPSEEQDLREFDQYIYNLAHDKTNTSTFYQIHTLEGNYFISGAQLELMLNSKHKLWFYRPIDVHYTLVPANLIQDIDKSFEYIYDSVVKTGSYDVSKTVNFTSRMHCALDQQPTQLCELSEKPFVRNGGKLSRERKAASKHKNKKEKPVKIIIE